MEIHEIVLVQQDHSGSQIFEYERFFHINQYSNIAPTISTRLNEHLPHECMKKVNLKN